MCMLLCRTNKQFWILELIDLFCLPQLQEAFAKGLLKPGMNVLLNKPKKLVNSVVSLELITNVELKTFPWIVLFFFHNTKQQLRPSSVWTLRKGLQNNSVYFMHSCANRYVILSYRRVWSGALQTSAKISPGWRGWTWLTHQLRTCCRRWKEKMLKWPMEMSP